MVKVLFTLDYEIHGNGDGCPYELMIEPTERMLALFERFGAKATLMADVGEILRFKEYYESTGEDRFHYRKIAHQLQDAVRRGHDVQLHIHSSYFKARFDGATWVQHWPEYSFATLPADRMDQMIKAGKRLLEELLIPVRADYRCIAFRAANWSVHPSEEIVRSLDSNGLLLDTSVFKYGRREGLVTFDYSHAHSEFAPWRASDRNLCFADDAGRLWEYPIYSEARWIGAFVTVNRMNRVLQSRRHRVGLKSNARKGTASPARASWLRVETLCRRHAWKADFNQCTGRQLIRAANRTRELAQGRPTPFVTIGHSKLFDARNERTLAPFLQFVAGRSAEFGFAVFEEVLPSALGESPLHQAAEPVGAK